MADSRLMPTVVGVQINKDHVFSKQPQSAIKLIQNFGVEGDSHAGPTDQHLYHIKRFGQRPNLRQVHLIQAELFDELLANGHVVRSGELGENISTRNIDLLELPTGTLLKIGLEAVIELTGLRNPCVQIENFQPGLLKHVVKTQPTGLERRAGVMSVVLKDGLVRPGDLIEVVLPALPHEPLIYRVPELEVVIESVRREAEGIHSLEFRPLNNGALPAFKAGAHIQLMLTNGMSRSYSLSNDPQEQDRYVVTVNKDSQSRGGSRHVHDQLRVSDRLTISPPRNNFVLDESAEHTVLIAGGIGITPLKAMIARLESVGRKWELHYAARARTAAAFVVELQRLEDICPGRVHFHFGAEFGGARMDLAAIVAEAPCDAHFYCCGPHSMIKGFEAATAELPRLQVHVEHFTLMDKVIVEQRFSIKLLRKQVSLEVPRGLSILDALLAANIDVPYSCSEGVCGACQVRVVEGLPDHRDLVLSEEERERNDRMMICCSGSKSPLLILDI